MPPRRLKKKSIKRLVEKRVAKAIEEYKKSRANLDSAGSSGGNPRNAGGTMNVHGCSHKTFMNGKPHTFNGTEGVVGLRRWIEKVEQVFETCKCVEEDKVMFAASTFEGRTLTWWNGNVHTLGLVNANHIPWTDFKMMMTMEYYPATEIQRMEQELWTLTLKGDDIEAYNNHFHELALMCPELVPTKKKRLKGTLVGFLKESKEISLLQSLQLYMMPSTWPVNWLSKQFRVRLLELVKATKENGNTTKETPTTITITTTITTTTTATETTTITNNKTGGRKLPGPMLQPQLRIECQKCQRIGHLEKDYRAILPGACNDFLQNETCYGCGEKGHLKNKCPKAGNQHNEGARARAYVVVENPQQNPNVVTGTFLLNDHYACILFDSGAEKSFVSSAFTPFIDISPTALNTSYEVELADGKVVSTNTVLRSCTLVLLNHVFKIDLLPTRLGSFDVIVGMDWLSYHRAVIDCYEKIVHIPLLNGKILEDERRIKEMNEGVKDPDQKSLKKRVVEETPKTEDTAKVPAKVDVTEQGTKKRKGGHIKMIARKRKRPQPDVNSDDEHKKCPKIVTFEGTMDSEVMERKFVIASLNKVSSPNGDYLVVYRANGNFRAFNCLLEGDLKIMIESSQEENDQSDFWDDQQDWEIVTWRLYKLVEFLPLESGIRSSLNSSSCGSKVLSRSNPLVMPDLRGNEVVLLMLGTKSSFERAIIKDINSCNICILSSKGTHAQNMGNMRVEGKVLLTEMPISNDEEKGSGEE
ncbi:putative reverse transcriptase domain-containing protein [Tanacetum coccineum]